MPTPIPTIARRVEKWLTSPPRWGNTAQQDLDELVARCRFQSLAHVTLPWAALRHPEPLDALLRAGFSLHKVNVPRAWSKKTPSLRWWAIFANATLGSHAVLDRLGVPSATPEELMKLGLELHQVGGSHSVRYLCQTLPDAMTQVIGARGLLPLVVAKRYMKTKSTTAQAMLAVLHCHEGLDWERLRNHLKPPGQLRPATAEEFAKTFNLLERMVKKKALEEGLIEAPRRRAGPRPRL